MDARENIAHMAAVIFAADCDSAEPMTYEQAIDHAFAIWMASADLAQIGMRHMRREIGGDKK